MKTQHSHIVTGLVTSMIKDLESTGLCSQRCLIKSSRMILVGYRFRGLPFLTINLPDCCKFLERSLSCGSIEQNRPVFHGRLLKARDARPAFLHSLWERLFDADGQLLDDADPSAVLWLRQVYLLFKKLNMTCDQEYTDASIEEYIAIERELPRAHQDTWDSESPVWRPRHGHPLWGDHRPQADLVSPASPEPSFNWAHFRTICGYLTCSLGVMDTWSLRPKHGPGVVADGKVIKYDFSVWPRKLGHIFPEDWFGSPDLHSRSSSDLEPPARMVAVPKSQKGPRLIAAEPCAHQWIQGGVQRWFEDQIRNSPLRHSIDFRRQDVSGELALKASADGLSATVDLSAASDRLSVRVVEYVFQSNRTLLDALHACRTRSVVIPAGLHSALPRTLILLRKFAPMGSACTFPVQTIVFTMVAVFSVLRARGINSFDRVAIDSALQEVRVFGDDIIVPSDSFDSLKETLTTLGLRVNSGKSFSQGNFRESCGTDGFKGLDVTPAYIRNLEPSDPDALVSIVECSSNLHKKAMWNTADTLLKAVEPGKRKLLLACREAIGSLSLYSFCNGEPPARKRWDKLLHCWTYRSLRIIPKEDRRWGRGEGTLLQFFACGPTPGLPWKSGQVFRTQQRLAAGWVRP